MVVKNNLLLINSTILAASLKETAPSVVIMRSGRMRSNHSPGSGSAHRLEIVDPGSAEQQCHGSSFQNLTSSQRPASGHKPPPTRLGSSNHSRSSTPLTSGQSTPIKETQLVSVRRKANDLGAMEVTHGASSISYGEGEDLELAELLSLRSDSAISSRSKLSNSTGKRNSKSRPEPDLGHDLNSNNHSNNDPDKPAETKEDDSDESSEDSDIEAERKAPNQLMMEFLDCIMKQDIENSLKLCQMILIYEPNNEKALQFLPLLQEKQRLDAEANESEGSEEGSDSSGSDEESDSDDDSEDSENTSDEEDDEDSESNTQTKEPIRSSTNKH